MLKDLTAFSLIKSDKILSFLDHPATALFLYKLTQFPSYFPNIITNLNLAKIPPSNYYYIINNLKLLFPLHNETQTILARIN